MMRPLALGAVLATTLTVVLVALGVSLFLSLLIGAVTLAGFVMDALTRADDYQWFQNVPRERNAFFICRRLRGSWCGRGVAIALLGDDARIWFNIWGYSWYNILPDDAPICFVQPKFWVQALAFWR